MIAASLKEVGIRLEHCITHGNVPKDYGPYLRPKTHIQHTHSQHLSTSTQVFLVFLYRKNFIQKKILQKSTVTVTVTTNDKCTHSNRMGLTEGDTHETGSGVCLFHNCRLLHPRPALTNCKSCRMQH